MWADAQPSFAAMTSENWVLEDKRVYGVKTTTTGAFRLALGQREDFSPVITFSSPNPAFHEGFGERGISEAQRGG